MKKYGKYEKRPEGVPAPAPKQSKKMKSALLQTYITSLLCMVLCVTMFFGTSFAWFTSEVNNSGNEIYIGTLDVELAKKTGTDASTGNATWASLSATANGQNTEKLFDGNIRWEPGYTALETIKVVNEGDLAFKYVLNFIEEVPEGEASLADIAKFFDVWVYDHTANKDKQGVVENPSSYSVLTSDGSGWTNVGTLDKLLSGDAVLTGEMNKDTVRQAGQVKVNTGTTDGFAAEHTYTIALHMNEHATDEVKDDGTHTLMGKQIMLNVKLVAYQMASEQDDLSGKYDQMVATEAELKEAVANGGRVALAADIELTDTLKVASDKTVILDLNGYTISQEKACTGSYNMISNNGNLTITGNGKLSFTDTGEGDSGTSWASYTIRNEGGTLVIENGTIEHQGTQAGNMNNAIFNYSGSTIINDGTINAPYSRSVRIWAGSLTINGGTFDGQVWAQPQNSNGSVVTINGGSFKPGSKGNDGSSVYITNDVHHVTFSVTGGSFATKIGVASPVKLQGCITGGTFTEAAKNGTDHNLFAASFVNGTTP